MNQPFFLHIVERLEGLLGKLPDSIRKPILSEITPLKELFLQQRPPRFVLTGSHGIPLHEFIGSLFNSDEQQPANSPLAGVYEWREVAVGTHGQAVFLDARGADDAALLHVQHELRRSPADMFFFLHDERDKRDRRKRETDNTAAMIGWNDASRAGAKVAVIDVSSRRAASSAAPAERRGNEVAPAIEAALKSAPALRDRLLRPFAFPLHRNPTDRDETFMAVVTHELPNEARVEMIRISRDRQAQLAVAHGLVKSTTAICAAVGAQPIPLADLPILTTLQLVMVSGIMYISGRERSMRAATEFTAALGANVGAGMILREGARALLKFIPGWGNVVCGMVAGAGTYAIGRAATVYFLEGGTLTDARRTFRSSRKKAPAIKPVAGISGEQAAVAETAS